MPLKIERNVDLTALNTLAISARASYLLRITSVEQIGAAIAFAKAQGLPFLIWGGGSNVVIGQAVLKAVILKIEIAGRSVILNDTTASVHVGAGEDWDNFVAWTTDQNLGGIESLSLIPGSVGAAPVQNVGAYGQEVSQTIASVEAFDTQVDKIIKINNADCEFGYRDSMFKHSGKGRYIITAVQFELSRDPHPEPSYASLAAELEHANIAKPTVAQVREAVIRVRRSKLPDPSITPTAGSFFHNPIVDADQFAQLSVDYPDIPSWTMSENQIKLAGAWLVEQCGFKGKIKNGVGIFDKQALALINPGHRPAVDVLDFRDSIISAVEERFGVKLQMEPELISL